MKLNNILKSNKVTAYGFAAIKGLEAVSNKEGSEVIISTLSPAIMAEMGINVYYAPVLERNTVFNTTDEVLQADLDLQLVTVAPYYDVDPEDIVIVSRHQGTIDILKSMYPDAAVMSGNLTPDDIKGEHITGTLPPHLVQHCNSYRAVTIKDFDYSRDGDLSGDELKSRIVISDPIQVMINRVSLGDLPDGDDNAIKAIKNFVSDLYNAYKEEVDSYVAALSTKQKAQFVFPGTGVLYITDILSNIDDICQHGSPLYNRQFDKTVELMHKSVELAEDVINKTSKFITFIRHLMEIWIEVDNDCLYATDRYCRTSFRINEMLAEENRPDLYNIVYFFVTKCGLKHRNMLDGSLDLK